MEKKNIEKIDRALRNAATEIQEAVNGLMQGEDFEALRSIMRAYEEIAEAENEVTSWED